jgi:hypothetical protein
MRKTLKNKKRCCGLCKYFKRGRGNRWKNKQFFLLRLAEKEIRNYTK